MPIDIAYGLPPSPTVSSPSAYANQLRNQLQEAYHRVRETMGHKLDLQKQLYDRKVHGEPIETGNLVWLHSPVPPKGCPWKFHRPWTGPFRVTQQISKLVYQVQNTQSPRVKRIVHFNRLKRCPENIRLQQPVPPVPKESPTTPPDPPGTHLTLIQDDNPPPPPPQPLPPGTPHVLVIDPHLFVYF